MNEEAQKENFLTLFDDFVTEQATDERNFEVSELGINASSEDNYQSYAISATRVVEDLIEQYSLEEVLEMTNIGFYENEISFEYDVGVEEYVDIIEYNVDKYKAKQELKDKPGFIFFGDRIINLLIPFIGNYDLIDFNGKIENEHDYVNLFVDKISELQTIDKKPLSKLQIKVMEKLIEITKLDIEKKLNEGREYKSYSIFNSNLKRKLECLNKIKININHQDPEDPVNNEIFELIKSPYNYHGDDLNSLIIKDKETKFYQDVVLKVQTLFNEDSLNVNHFYQEITRMMKFEIFKEDKKSRRSFSKNEIDESLYTTSKIEEKFNFISDVVSMCREYKSLIKENQSTFDIKEMKSTEDLFDYINGLIEESENKKFIKYIIGSYKHLATETNLKLLTDLRHNKVNKSLIKSEVKGLALVKDPSILEKQLKKILNSDIGAVISKNSLDIAITMKRINANIIFSDHNIACVVLGDLNAATAIAPSKWCISKNANLFNNYKGEGENVIIFDFKKELDDNNSIVGVSIYKNGKIKSAFDKNNRSVSDIEWSFGIEQSTKIKLALIKCAYDKEMKKVENGTLNIDETIDPIYIINNSEFLSISSKFDDKIESLTMQSIRSSSLSKGEILNNIISLSKKKPELDILSNKLVQEILKEENHPLIFINEKENKKKKDKVKINFNN